jgi:fumarate reductase subunit D
LTPPEITALDIAIAFEGGFVTASPPGSDWVDLIEWYIFKLFLLVSFVYTLWQVLKHKLKE